MPEEVAERAPIPSPDMPTASELDDHLIDHLPYRDWCDCCVEAFGRERSHRTSGGHPRERRVPVLHLDYMFLTKKGLIAQREILEEERAGALTVLVMYDAYSR